MTNALVLPLEGTSVENANPINLSGMQSGGTEPCCSLRTLGDGTTVPMHKAVARRSPVAPDELERLHLAE